MEQVEQKIVALLSDYMSPMIARSVLDLSIRWSRVKVSNLVPGDMDKLIREIRKGVHLYVAESSKQEQCLNTLVEHLSVNGSGDAKTNNSGSENGSSDGNDKIEYNGTEYKPPNRSVSIPIHTEMDIVLARNEGRAVCEELGFSQSLQIRVSTAISELARNIVLYVGSGQIVIRAIDQPSVGIEIIASDQGQGIDNIDTVLSGSYVSKTGMGMGLLGTRNLMDQFNVDTQPGHGTEVIARKYLQ